MNRSGRGPEGIEESPGGVRRVLAGHDGADHGDTCGTGGGEEVDVLHGDATDPNDRDIHGARHRLEPLGSDPFVPDILLRGRAEHGAAPDVVGAGGLGVPGGVGVIDGYTDQERRWRDLSRSGEREVVRPEVDAVGTGGEGDVEAVVDEEERRIGGSAPATGWPVRKARATSLPCP